MKLLEYPLGHQKFVGYPRRWYLQINDAIMNCETRSYESLSETVIEIIRAAEHIDKVQIGHFAAILLWSSYCSGVDVFQGSLTSFVVEMVDSPSHVSPRQLSKFDAAEVNLMVQKVKQSKFYRQSTYLQIVIDTLVHLVDDKDMPVPDTKIQNILKWRFGSTNLWSVVSMANEFYSNGKLSLLLQFLYESSQSYQSVPVLIEYLLWNIAVTLHNLGEEVQCEAILQLCYKTFHPEMITHTISCMKSNFPSYVAVLQQLVCKNFPNRKKYCNQLKEIFSDAAYLCKYYVTICSSDLAYLSEDSHTQLELQSKLQSYDLTEILESDSEQMNRRRLATCCVLLSQSFSYLDKHDLQSSYEYFVLSYNQAKELIGDDADVSWFNVVKDRYLAQLYSLEGYFLVLLGKYDIAAVAYGKSYSYDSHLIMSLYNQCLLLMKLGKVSVAKRNWTPVYESIGIRSIQHHEFSKLHAFLTCK